MIAGNSRPRLIASRGARLGVAALLAFGVVYSCSEGAEDVIEAPQEHRVPALRSAAACAWSASEDFLATTDALVESVSAWNEAPDDEEKRDAAKAAWEVSRASWQLAELTQYGPAGAERTEASGTIGGLAYRDEIYSYPVINSCKVDQGLVSEVYQESLTDVASNIRGLDALEYLLFYTGTDNSCPSTTNINTDGSWEAVSDLTERRAAYAFAVALDIATTAADLEKAWDPAHGNFFAELENAGSAEVYESQSQALEDVVNAAIYLDLILKDSKLGMPLGTAVKCSLEACPESAEHRSAVRSIESMRDNFLGFEKLWQGCGEDAKGLRALLVEEGGGALATQIDEALDAVDEALDAITEEDVNTLVAEDRESADALYAKVKDLTDLLKDDLTQIFVVSLRGAKGDND